MPDRCTDPTCEQHWPAEGFTTHADRTMRHSEVDHDDPPPHQHWWPKRNPGFDTLCYDCGEHLHIEEQVAYVHPHTTKRKPRR